MSALRIITAGAAGGSIRVRGIECAYLIYDPDGEIPAIGVQTVEHLRELLPALTTGRTALVCTDAERAALRALFGISDA